MGAWDVGPFGNDGAWDLIVDLGHAGDPVLVLREALEYVVAEQEYIDNPEAQAAVCAAVLVAVACGADDAELREHKIDPPPGVLASAAVLRPLAAQALDRLATPGDNEWYELWDEAGLLDEAITGLTPFRDALLDTR